MVLNTLVSIVNMLEIEIVNRRFIDSV